MKALLLLALPAAPFFLLIENYIIHDTLAVIPVQAGIQQDKKAFCLNPLDSGLRRNDV